jgi:hypothetical protein
MRFCFFGAKKAKNSIRVPLGKILDREFPDPQLDVPNDYMIILLVLLVRIPSSHGCDGAQKNSPHISGKMILVSHCCVLNLLHSRFAWFHNA